MVKKNAFEPNATLPGSSNAAILISSSRDSSSSDTDVSSSSPSEESATLLALLEGMHKKRKLSAANTTSQPPVGSVALAPATAETTAAKSPSTSASSKSCRQFWKAGDYDGGVVDDSDFAQGGIDHVRVHPKFLHSNATSHKWALGAFAELLDNSLDEVCNGATHVHVDVIQNKTNGSKMLLIEDNGGGMNSHKLRSCMSLGYSLKGKEVNTIGKYGNGFKTSTMRLGADVIVFSSCKKDQSHTRSIGLLSYSFLRSTGKEDIVVPMVDYMRGEQEWNKLIRSSLADWNKNLETILQWSPFSNKGDLLRQFNLMDSNGTRIIIYNLWEDDEGNLELDFEADPYDIQLRGVNRNEKNIKMAEDYPNSRHFLTYRHSLRSYASILYRRLPQNFRVILRGQDVERHNIVNDMMHSKVVIYRPKYSDMAAEVTIGFVKDAKAHIDIQGFCVYHKNRLIKPFWRVWNAAGSGGRGVIGALEADFLEPAHDKQGFERTNILARLETRLVDFQKKYWYENCHVIGYGSKNQPKELELSVDKETSARRSSRGSKRAPKPTRRSTRRGNRNLLTCDLVVSSPSTEEDTGFLNNDFLVRQGGSSSTSIGQAQSTEGVINDSNSDNKRQLKQVCLVLPSVGDVLVVEQLPRANTIDKLQPENIVKQLREENSESKECCRSTQNEIETLVRVLEEHRQNMEVFKKKVAENEQKLVEKLKKSKETHEKEMEALTEKLKVANDTIQKMREKMKQLENIKLSCCKMEDLEQR